MQGIYHRLVSRTTTGATQHCLSGILTVQVVISAPDSVICWLIYSLNSYSTTPLCNKHLPGMHTSPFSHVFSLRTIVLKERVIAARR